MKKYTTLISLGSINILHSMLHLIQFIQSLMLINTGINGVEHESAIEKLLHNPQLNILWGAIGLFTLYLGIKDFLHHRKCDHKK